MKKTNITEGEWVHEEWDDLTHDVVCDNPPNNIPVLIASVNQEAPNILPLKETVANAKAISAVPEMINALICINESDSARKAMGSVARTKMINALKKAGVEFNEG